MFCDKCGAEIPDGAAFCSECGNKIQAVEVKKEKDLLLALIISFILTGLGIAYAGNVKKGILLFAGGLICSIIGFSIPFFKIIAVLIWISAMYLTYIEVEKANGRTDPNIIEDWKGWSKGKQIGAIVVALILFLIIIGSVIGALSPNNNSSTDIDDDYTSSSLLSDNLSSSSSGSSGSVSSSSSASSDTYSSSSNGHDVESHYEGEYGSADTYGTVYDDGSVESHQTGHTDYGDYKIDSYMDSNGNLHGTVDVGGQTYHVSS